MINKQIIFSWVKITLCLLAFFFLISIASAVTITNITTENSIVWEMDNIITPDNLTVYVDSVMWYENEPIKFSQIVINNLNSNEYHRIDIIDDEIIYSQITYTKPSSWDYLGKLSLAILVMISFIIGLFIIYAAFPALFLCVIGIFQNVNTDIYLYLYYCSMFFICLLAIGISDKREMKKK
jgi:hypothetical protein